jgi:hypothetical protein
MAASNWIFSGMSILAVVCIAVGLWIARKFLPTCINWLRPKLNNDLLSRPLVQFMLWLAIGGLFTLPLLDFVRWLGNLANLALLPAGEVDNGLNTFLGLIPSQAYYGFYAILAVVIYGIVIWLSLDYLPANGQLDKTEHTFILLSIASLVYHGVSNIFSYVFAFQNPIITFQPDVGSAGFTIEVAVGVAILLIILLGLNLALPNHPAGSMPAKQ